MFVMCHAVWIPTGPAGSRGGKPVMEGGKSGNHRSRGWLIVDCYYTWFWYFQLPWGNKKGIVFTRQPITGQFNGFFTDELGQSVTTWFFLELHFYTFNTCCFKYMLYKFIMLPWVVGFTNKSTRIPLTVVDYTKFQIIRPTTEPTTA